MLKQEYHSIAAAFLDTIKISSARSVRSYFRDDTDPFRAIAALYHDISIDFYLILRVPFVCGPLAQSSGPADKVDPHVEQALSISGVWSHIDGAGEELENDGNGRLDVYESLFSSILVTRRIMMYVLECSLSLQL